MDHHSLNLIHYTLTKSQNMPSTLKNNQGGSPIHNSVTVTLVIVPIVTALATSDAGQQSFVKPIPN